MIFRRTYLKLRKRLGYECTGDGTIATSPSELVKITFCECGSWVIEAAERKCGGQETNDFPVLASEFASDLERLGRQQEATEILSIVENLK